MMKLVPGRQRAAVLGKGWSTRTAVTYQDACFRCTLLGLCQYASLCNTVVAPQISDVFNCVGQRKYSLIMLYSTGPADWHLATAGACFEKVLLLFVPESIMLLAARGSIVHLCAVRHLPGDYCVAQRRMQLPNCVGPHFGGQRECAWERGRSIGRIQEGPAGVHAGAQAQLAKST